MKCVEIKCGKRDTVEIRDGNGIGDPLSRLSTLNYLSSIGYRIVILNIERPLADSNSNNNGKNYNNVKSEEGGTAGSSCHIIPL